METKLKLALFFAIILLIILFLILLFTNIIFGDQSVAQLKPELRVTAIYAVSSNAIPSFIVDIEPPPNSSIISQTPICIVVDPTQVNYSNTEFPRWSRIYVNGVRYTPNVSYTGIPRSNDYVFLPNFCFAPIMLKGLVLIEIRLTDSIIGIFDTSQTQSFSWVYDVTQ